MNDELTLDGIKAAIAAGDTEFAIKNATSGAEIKVLLDFSQRQRDMLIAGGLLNYTKQNS